MVFVASGLNHKTAPLSVREKMAKLSVPDSPALEKLKATAFIKEALILSTCNRTELYYVLDDTVHTPESFLVWLLEAFDISVEDCLPHIYHYEKQEGVRHLLRVASGLDSMMLGEPQILGQLKKAFREANDAECIKQELGHLLPFIFSASKKVRTQSGIGHNPISIASAAVRLIGDFFSNYESLDVLIIGSGETAALVAKYLFQQGVRQFTIASRTRENADKLALAWDAKTISITDIPEKLAVADVVISATACPLPFIDKAMVEQAAAFATRKTLFLLDLAVPRDITPDVKALEYVKLYNIEDLHLAIEKSLEERRQAATHAETLITPLVESYSEAHRMRYADDAICDYRKQMHSLVQYELTRATKKIDAGHAHADIIQEISERLYNKLTHATTVGLKEAAKDKRHDLVDLAHYLLRTAIPKISHEEIT